MRHIKHKFKLLNLRKPAVVARIERTVRIWWQHLASWQRVACMVAAAVILLSAIIPTIQIIIQSYRYTLDDATLALVGKSNPNLAAKLTYDSQNSRWQFNKSAITDTKTANDPAENIPAALKAQLGGGGKGDESLYAINFPTNPKKGVEFYDAGTGLSFTMTPEFKLHGGKATKDGRLVYPMQGGAKLIYTPKNNGMKEDIVLPKFVSKELAYSYKLDLPSTLTAKIQADGSVGIFSIDPALLGNVSTSSNMDAEKLKSAREHAEKTHLLFAIPAPVIVQSGGHTSRATAKFGLSGDTLTVTARDMDTVQYPASVDPSVVVTSSSDFRLGGNNEGNVDYSTTDQIQRGATTGGTVGSWSTTTSFNSTLGNRSSAGSTEYNGYVYLIGGYNGVTQSNAAYAPVNSDGTIGSWTATTSLPEVRAQMRAVAYNGYMYVVGGTNSSGTFYDTVRYAPINSDGSLGSWLSTTSFSGVRSAAGTVAYGGFMYIIGGIYNNYSSSRSDVQYAPINADGSLGTWSTTTSIAAARSGIGSAAYNGYIYITGGNDTSGTVYGSVQKAKINSDGTIGSWTNEANLPVQLSSGPNSSVLYGGYLYVAGGWNGEWDGAPTQVDTVYYARVLANGSIGPWNTTSSFSTSRQVGALLAYNNRLYILGGDKGDDATFYSDVQYTSINSSGATTPYTTSGNTFTTTRRGGQTVIYNNYLYVMGGDNGGTPVNTVYYAPINADGTIGSFASTTAFTTSRTYFAAVAYGGYMYVIGGCSSAYSSCTTAGNNLTTVYRAPINSNGTIDTWTNTNNTSIPAARYGITAVVYNNYLYVMGGLNGSTFSNAIYYHAISTTDGSLSGAWSTATNLPASMAYTQVVAYGGNLYVAGGCTAGALTCTTSRNAVHYAAFNTDGTLGSFTSSSAFTTNRGDFGLVAVNNRLYLTGGRTNTTYYGDTQSAPINTDGSVGTWAAISGATLATNRYGIGMATTNGNIYVTGGYNGSTYYNNVQIAGVNNGGGGAVGSWNTDSTNPFTTARSRAQFVTYNNYLYLLGGGSNLNTVQYASLNSDGSVGAWASTSSFATGRQKFGAAASNGYMYLFGGYNGSTTYYKDIQYARINSNGSLGAWASAGSNAVNGGQGTCLASYNGYVYTAGGWDGTTDHADVRYAAQNSNGTIGSWQSGGSFTGGRSNLGCVAYGGYLYISGGEEFVGTNDVQYAAINSNGSLGSWQYATGFNLGRVDHAMFAYNGFMYIEGGTNTTSPGNFARQDMQYAPINSNGTLGEWRHTTYLADTDYSEMVTAGGYVYSINTSDTNSYYASLNSIDRKASYSKLIDLGAINKITGITYSGTLPDGTTQIRYRTAGSNGTFGQTYSMQWPPTPAGECVGAYSNGRYVWLSITLDDSTAGTSASLTDVTVAYESTRPSPDIRLRGGKALQSGNLTGLDTCQA